MSGTQRLFIAAGLPEEGRGEIVRVAAGLRSRAGVPLRWVEAGNLHLALRFLGETPDEAIAAIAEAIAEAADGFAEFELRFGELGISAGAGRACCGSRRLPGRGRLRRWRSGSMRRSRARASRGGRGRSVRM